MDIPDVIGVIVGAFGLIYGIYRNVQANKKERLNEKLGIIKESFDKSMREVEKDVLQGSTDHVTLEKRVRKLESIQITEQRVQTMLKDRVEPIENAVTKLEDKIERNHRELSTEIQIATREHSAQLSKLIESVSYVTGIVEGRRKNDNPN